MVRRQLVAALASLVALSSCAYSGEPQQPGFTEVRRLDDGDRVSQTFVPRGDRLARIDLLVGTFRVEEPDAQLTLEVTGAGQRREVIIDGADIRDAAWLRVAFEPIPDAAGRPFSAAFTHHGSDPLAVFVNPDDPYEQGALDDGDGDLAFRVGHAGNVGGLVAALARIPAEFGRRLARDALFATVWVLALLAASAVVALPLFARRAPRGHR